MASEITPPAQPEVPAIPGATWWRKRPVAVEAVHWTGANFAAVKDFAARALGAGEVARGALPLWVVKSQALCHVQRGDWIIREPDGSGFYPCAADVFAATYEPASGPLVMPANEPWTPEQLAEFQAHFDAAIANPGPLRVLPSDHWKDRAEAAEAKLAEITAMARVAEAYALPDAAPVVAAGRILAVIGGDEEAAVAAVVRERFRAALREHYLAGITCDGAQERDNPVCGCSRVFLGWHPSVGEAREAWIRHVLGVVDRDKISDEKEAGRG